MKGLCYIALIIGFFMFYQQNPLYTIIILVLFLGVYLFFKSRSSGGNNRILDFLSGKSPQQDNNTDDLITLFMIHQILNFDTNSKNPSKERQVPKNKEEVERTKQEILRLLEEH